ncbi:hypothetical protein B0H16DRAFT_527408 [Mycena metata]|uniref:Uncharacterized protein n=1 Tax=Mycena metata TaxID=1033252 RepID=A0AAD7JCP9_9AGAR|nr:hypothetical protein B0H16DRAFT_527408 [Mycena metata]
MPPFYPVPVPAPPHPRTTPFAVRCPTLEDGPECLACTPAAFKPQIRIESSSALCAGQEDSSGGEESAADKHGEREAALARWGSGHGPGLGGRWRWGREEGRRTRKGGRGSGRESGRRDAWAAGNVGEADADAAARPRRAGGFEFEAGPARWDVWVDTGRGGADTRRGEGRRSRKSEPRWRWHMWAVGKARTTRAKIERRWRHTIWSLYHVVWLGAACPYPLSPSGILVYSSSLSTYHTSSLLLYTVPLHLRSPPAAFLVQSSHTIHIAWISAFPRRSLCPFYFTFLSRPPSY